MKNIYKSLVLTGVLALASTSAYAGNKSCSADNTGDKVSSASCHSSKWNSAKHVNLSTTAERPGYVMTSKGERFCTAKAIKDRENGYTTMVRRDSSDWNKDVEASKDRPVRTRAKPGWSRDQNAVLFRAAFLCL